jgi:phosphoglucosamine mutase
MTNLGVRHGYKDLGIDFIETDVGDRFVMQQMLFLCFCGTLSHGH